MALYFQEGDRESLLQTVTPLMAVEYLGIPTQRNGNNISILCPNPEHNDRHFGSCIISHGGRTCHCYAQCNRNFTALQIIMWHTGCSYYEGMCTLASLAGRETDFEASKRPSKKTAIQRKTMSNDIKELLGLSVYPRIRNILNESDTRPEKENCFREEEGNFISFDTGNFSPWVDLLKEPETLEWLIQNKCKEKLVSIDLLKRQLRDPYSSDVSAKAYECMKEFKIPLSGLLHALEERYEKIEEVYVENGGRIRSPEKMAYNLIGLSLACS